MTDEQLQTIAQELLNNLASEKKVKEVEVHQLEGAAQGINLLYLKILQVKNDKQTNTSGEDSTTKIKSVPGTSKKRKKSN